MRLILGTFWKISQKLIEKVEKSTFQFFAFSPENFLKTSEKVRFLFFEKFWAPRSRNFLSKTFRRNYFSVFCEQQRSLARRDFLRFSKMCKFRGPQIIFRKSAAKAESPFCEKWTFLAQFLLCFCGVWWSCVVLHLFENTNFSSYRRTWRRYELKLVFSNKFYAAQHTRPPHRRPQLVPATCHRVAQIL